MLLLRRALCSAALAEPPPARLLVALGNPGAKFAETRHNVGWMALDAVRERWPALQPVEGRRGDKFDQWRLPQLEFCGSGGAEPDLVDAVSERRRERTRREGVPYPAVDVRALRPLTFMNLSGSAVRSYVDREGLRLKRKHGKLGKGAELALVYDDSGLPFGEVRVRLRGGPGGHNGVRDVIAKLRREDFVRVRIGVGKPSGVVLKDHVLRGFDMEERERLPLVMARVCDVLRVYWHRGGEAAAAVANSGSVF